MSVIPGGHASLELGEPDVAALLHPEWLEHLFLHYPGEGLAGDRFDYPLQVEVGFTRIAELLSWLLGRLEWTGLLPPIGKPCGVTENLANRDPLHAGAARFRKWQVFVERLIQVERLCVHQPENRIREERFAERGRLEDSIIRGGLGGILDSPAEAPGPGTTRFHHSQPQPGHRGQLK